MENLLNHVILLLLVSLSYSTAHNDTDIVVQDVVVIAGANPSVAVIHWKPLVDDRILSYTVHYSSNTTASSNEMSAQVSNLANSVILSTLAEGHLYTFTVSAEVRLNGRVTVGPRSANTSIITGRQKNVDLNDNNRHSTSALVFYGCILVLSMLVNLVLLILSYALLRQLRSKYSGSNVSSINSTTDSPIIELKTVKHSYCHDDVPRKPAREHSPKEVFLEVSNGRCTPAKQAEVEVP